MNESLFVLLGPWQVEDDPETNDVESDEDTKGGRKTPVDPKKSED